MLIVEYANSEMYEYTRHILFNYFENHTTYTKYLFSVKCVTFSPKLTVETVLLVNIQGLTIDIWKEETRKMTSKIVQYKLKMKSL
jgi:hypothetical protein